MRLTAAVALLALTAPVASALAVPVPQPDLPLGVHTPALPLPDVAAETPVARVAAGSGLRHVAVEVALDAPVLDEPVQVYALEKAPHAAPGRDALHARLAKLADRRADKALALPARAVPSPAAPSPASPSGTFEGFAYAPPTPADDSPAPRAQAAFATNAPTGDWRSPAAFAAFALLALLAPLALYHRLRGARTLEHATRARVFDLLRAQPGLTPADAARALAIDPKTARYHLVRLAQEGLAVAEGRARTMRYFAAGAVAAHERPAFVAANDSRAVLDAVLRAPGLTKTELAASMGVARPTVNWHLRRLLSAGLVRCERDGRGVRVHPAGEILPKPLNSRPL